MRIFFTSNEWSKAVFDKLLIFGNKTGYGWADKIWHCQSCLIIFLILSLCFHINILISYFMTLLIGILWEIVVDCNITKEGISRFDLVADTLGATIGLIILFIGGI